MKKPIGDAAQMNKVLGFIVMGTGFTSVALGVISIVIMASGLWRIFG